MVKVLEIRLEDFPGETRALAEVIGVEQTLLLIARWEGKHFYIPFRIPDDHPIVHQIGRDAADRLQESFGGFKLRLCHSIYVKRKARDREIFSLSHLGPTALAKKYSLSLRQVSAIILRQYRHSAPQRRRKKV